MSFKNNMFFCSYVFKNNMFFCSYVFKKNMFFCSYVFKITCSHVLMSLQKKHVLMSFINYMFSCLTAACVVRFGDRTSYASLNT